MVERVIHPNANTKTPFERFTDEPIRTWMTLSQISVVRPTLPIVWLRSEVDYNTAISGTLCNDQQITWEDNNGSSSKMHPNGIPSIKPFPMLPTAFVPYSFLFNKKFTKHIVIIWFMQRVHVAIYCYRQSVICFAASFVCSFSFKNWHDLCRCVVGTLTHNYAFNMYCDCI